MVWTANRIVLISRGRYDELPLAADAYPGMLMTPSGTSIIPHNVVGGGGQLIVAQEDVGKGGDITQKLNNLDACPLRRPAKGDLMYMLLQNAQNVAANVPLMSAGDGTLVAAPSGGSQELYNILTPSATITNLGTETVFSNGTYTLPANFLAVGDVINIHIKAFLIAVNSTNTHRIRTYIGATTLADSTAVALIANDVVIQDITMTIRTITASGTFIADGTVKYSISGTFTTTPFTVASTTLDSTATQAIAVKSLASATSSGNQIRLDEMLVSIVRSGGMNVAVYSAEAINNSAGAGSNPVSGFSSAAFIRCYVP